MPQAEKKTAPKAEKAKAVVHYGFCVPYSAQVAHNAELWEQVSKAMADSKGKGVTMASLKTICGEALNPGFANYIVKRGWLAPLGESRTKRGQSFKAAA